jgi:hypothetical protein
MERGRCFESNEVTVVTLPELFTMNAHVNMVCMHLTLHLVLSL